MTVPGQSKVTYSYDKDNRLTKIKQGTASVALTYDADSRAASLTLPDGITRTTTYDAASEPTAITFTHGATQVGALDYSYTADGQVSTVAGSLAAAGLPAAITSASYNADNELTSQDGVSYSYDADGNLLSDGTSTYTWNDRGELASISGATTASFSYDPFGRRQSAAVNGTATSYLYDGRNVVQELSGTTPTVNLLTGGLDQVFQLTTPSGANSSFLTDELGSTIALANSAGQVTTSYTYDPSGSVTASGAASPNTFDFAGTQNDGTGLYAMGARYYSPSLGRFISQDPTGFNGGTSDLYSYAHDDPINQSDPTGTTCGTMYPNGFPEDYALLGAVVGAGIGLLAGLAILAFLPEALFGAVVVVGEVAGTGTIPVLGGFAAPAAIPVLGYEASLLGIGITGLLGLGGPAAGGGLGYLLGGAYGDAQGIPLGP
jgi:RHS repeat-associated protein